MLNIIISIPIIGILLIQIFDKRENRKNNRMIFSIITMYISLYMLIRMNNNNAEYQFRDFIDLDYIKNNTRSRWNKYEFNISNNNNILILILLKERKDNKDINEIIKLLLGMESMLIFLFSSLDLFFSFFLNFF